MRWSIMGKLASSLLEFGGSPVAEQGEYDGPHPSGLASRGCPAGAPVVGGEGVPRGGLARPSSSGVPSATRGEVLRLVVHGSVGRP